MELEGLNATRAIDHILRPETRTSADSLRTIYRVEPLVAVLALILTAPPLLVIASIITLLARRTPLVRHRRVGWRGAELPVIKLRTMWAPKQKWSPLFSIEDVSDTIPTTKNGEDDRVTSRFAAWCRKHSI